MRASSALVLLSVALNLAACAPTVNSYNTSKAPTRTPVQEPQPVPAQGASMKVALLLPLTGPQASLGQSLLNAAQLAVYDVGDNSFALLPQDTQGTPAGAAAATKQALADGAALLIGPVFTPEVEASQQALTGYQVPTLALSNNETLADRDTYVLGLSPEDQISRVLQHAAASNLTRVAALLPNSAYGDALSDAFSTTASKLGLTVVRLDRYVANGDPALTAQGFMAGLTQAGGAQALLLGETGQGLLNLASALQTNGFNPAVTRPLGTGQWEDGSAARSTALLGGWYAAPAGTQRRAFTARYEQTYGSKPVAITSLAYDATALAAVLARKPGGFNAQNLHDPMGFGGVDGIFRLSADGKAERGLAVFELTPQGGHIIDAAPIAFNTGVN